MAFDHKHPEYEMFNAQAADGYADPIPVEGYKYVTVMIYGASSPNLTLFALGSAQESAPDFSEAQSFSNHYTKIQMDDYEDSSVALAGDTGLALDGSEVTVVRTLRMNIDRLKWLTFQVDSRTAGNISVKVNLSNDRVEN